MLKGKRKKKILLWTNSLAWKELLHYFSWGFLHTRKKETNKCPLGYTSKVFLPWPANLWPHTSLLPGLADPGTQVTIHSTQPPALAPQPSSLFHTVNRMDNIPSEVLPSPSPKPAPHVCLICTQPSYHPCYVRSLSLSRSKVALFEYLTPVSPSKI